jgi:hypothetical protein
LELIELVEFLPKKTSTRHPISGGGGEGQEGGGREGCKAERVKPLWLE